MERVARHRSGNVPVKLPLMPLVTVAMLLILVALPLLFILLQALFPALGEGSFAGLSPPFPR